MRAKNMADVPDRLDADTKAITQLINEIRHDIDSLDKSLCALREDITPILQPEETSENPAFEDQASYPISPLANELVLISRRLHLLEGFTQRLTNRVDF
jgi:hypothetical protein